VQDLFGVLVDDPGQAALVQAESAAGAAQGTVDLGTGLLSD
jgi:hypothetical protein